MAYRIVKTVVDGVTFTGCELTGTDQETAMVGVAEATVTAAGTGDTAVASPTTNPNPGGSREGIDYKALGKLERCAVCGAVRPRREMVMQRGAWVDRECYDERVPTRGRGGVIPSRRSRGL